MRITGPTNPFHLAGAYGLRPRPALRVAPGDTLDCLARQCNSPVAIGAGGDVAGAPTAVPQDSLLAGSVPGGIDFSPEDEASAVPGAPAPPAGGPLAMYRRPAERNAAATGVFAGRVIDVAG